LESKDRNRILDAMSFFFRICIVFDYKKPTAL
jgi:hypothetical protein